MNPFDRVSNFLARFDQIDAMLVKAGFPPTSKWWRDELERYLRGTGRRWVCRVGRRGGKSSTMCRVAITHAMFGGWSVARGDTPIVAFISTEIKEARARLKTIRDLLEALEVPCELTDRDLRMTFPGAKGSPARSVTFRVVTGSVRAVGFTAIAVFADEMSRWETEGANPAAEIMASVRPAMFGVPDAIEVCYSSPWSTDDYHAKLFDDGDNEHQTVSFAPTWIARPDKSESETHADEPDPDKWSREYAAIPSERVNAGLVRTDVMGCFTRGLLGHPVTSFVAIDPSNMGGGDTFSWVAGRVSDRGEVAIEEIGGYDGKAQEGATSEDAVHAIADVARRWGVTNVFGDQGSGSGALTVLFAQQGLAYQPFIWTLKSKADAVLALRRMMRNRALYVREHPAMKAQMLRLKAHLTDAGIKYDTNGEDYVSALITVMHALLAGAIWGGGGGSEWDRLRPVRGRARGRQRRGLDRGRGRH
jgi:hypothetical protein